MGLTVHIHARAAATLSLKEIADRVARWHAAAQTLAADGRIDRVFEPSDESNDLNQFAASWFTRPCADDPNSATAMEVPPIEGWIFLIQPGSGCEPLVLGLCRYPEEFADPRDAGPELNGWRLSTSCKTQYASLQGWEHFRRCHTGVIDLAALGPSLGIDVRMEDEGGYWPQRNETRLRAMLERLNRLAAGLAGALKDATDDGSNRAIQSPIFGHPDFERLEADASAGPDAEKIAAAMPVIRDSADGR